MAEGGEVEAVCDQVLLLNVGHRNGHGEVGLHTFKGVALGGWRRGCQAGEVGHGSAAEEGFGADGQHVAVDVDFRSR